MRKKRLFNDHLTNIVVSLVKKSAEEQIKALLARQSFPPLEVIIPILEKAGRGEQELTNQMYDMESSITNGVREILNLKDRDMKTAAKIFELICDYSGQKIEPIELSHTRFSLSISDCPMLHVGKDVKINVKSKFCDLCCSTGARAIFGTVLGPEVNARATCSWDKKLIRGAGKCTVTYELGKNK
jgi:hypothetical protein